ncbi:MAG TPA: VWA domain-containing protein [Solirubrobacteraceae bacterium]
MRGRVVVIVIALVAVVLAAVGSLGGDDSGDKGGSTGSGGGAKPAGDAIRISLAYSPEKEVLLAKLLDEFNRDGVESGGRPIFVDASIVASGEAQSSIAKGRLKPTVWSPASSLWGRLLNFEADQEYVADENPSLVRTPLVIAMWEPLARALGWPKQKAGFRTIVKLALAPDGWASVGKPEFGRFKLGHTNPDFSTSGLSAVAAEYFTVTKRREGLTEEDVTKASVRRSVQAIERSIIHYGDTTLFFAEQMKRYGPAYASAVAMEEATLVDFNKKRGSGTKLVGLYPTEGTFVSDNPFIVLSAPWVTREQRAAAGVLQKWLADRLTPERAAAGGFRPGEPDAKPLPPVDAAHGVDVRQPARTLSLPLPRVLDRVRRTWREDRKPANVMLALDVSGSMGEENKLEEAKRGLESFFRQVSPRDRVGLVVFDDRVRLAVPIAPFAENGQRLRQTVAELQPDGETAVYDATLEAFEEVRDLDDEERINAVVALTDGEDNSSGISDGELARRLDQSPNEGEVVRVFTIAYGKGANAEALSKFATASGGKAFQGDPAGIEGVYLSISSFF